MPTSSLSPEDCYGKVLTELRASNLHYCVQESPYSLYITIRKKFAKDPSKVFPKVETPNVSISTLMQQIENLESMNKSLKVILRRNK